MKNNSNRLSKLPRRLFVLSVLIFVASLFFFFSDFSTNIRVEEAGGAYAFSPDKRWKASISDGYSYDNKKSYAVIYLWDLKKYPSLANDRSISTMWGKRPEVQLAFPKDFHARDAKCDVTWKNKDVFEIKFASKDGLQLFSYDISQRTFSLTTLPVVPNSP